MPPTTTSVERCVGARRDGSRCTRRGSVWRDADGAVWLCEQHADLLAEYEQERGHAAAVDRLAHGVQTPADAETVKRYPWLKGA